LLITKIDHTVGNTNFGGGTMKIALSGISISLMLCLTPIGAPAFCQPVKVIEGISPKWVIPPPVSPQDAPPKDGLIQIFFADNQVRVSKKGVETYTTQRFKILRPEALQVSNLRFIWRPANGPLTVHSILLRRKDGSTTEMIGKVKFQIIQREENLEQAVLTGLTTAIFPIPGVEVGDEIEFAATVVDRDKTFADQAFGALQLPMIEIGGAFRARLLRADGITLYRKISPDLEKPTLVDLKSDDELMIRINNPRSPNVAVGAPGRFGVGRLIEFSSFTGWPEISTTFWKLFEQASNLAPNSPVRGEISKIAAASSDPEVRALMALRLVQDRTRYVYVGLGAGNYTPASADETWERRYGDCKGKTALLLAILKELGIPAEGVLVNQTGLDGLRDRLAAPSLFDHILVRVALGDKSYWLDGTQFNSSKLAYLPQPTFRSALPLRSKGSHLEDVSATVLSSPAVLEIVEIDATAGSAKPGRISVRQVLHGNQVTQLRTGLASLVGNDLKQAIRNYLGFATGTTESEESSWGYDEKTGVLTVKWAGTQKLDWEGDEIGELEYLIPSAGFAPPNELARPKEQDQTLPWAVDFPYFKCWVTTIRLPPDKGQSRWTYRSRPVDRLLGGIRYYRKATIQKAVVQTVMSKRALQAELTPAEAAEIATMLPKFNKEKSFIYRQVLGKNAGNTDDPRPVLDPNSIDWMSAGKICQPSTAQ
jgi:hypothetical protein